MHRHLVQTVCSRSKADRILPICNTLDPVFQYQGIPSEIPDKDKEDIPWMCDEMGKAAEDNVTVVVAIIRAKMEYTRETCSWTFGCSGSVERMEDNGRANQGDIRCVPMWDVGWPNVKPDMVRQEGGVQLVWLKSPRE